MEFRPLWVSRPAGPTGSVREGSAQTPGSLAIQGSLPGSLCSVLPLRFGRKRLQ